MSNNWFRDALTKRVNLFFIALMIILFSLTILSVTNENIVASGASIETSTRLNRLQTAVTFNKSFTPATIGPGSVTTLQFNITNNDPLNPVSDLAFTDNLPADVVIATPANASHSCVVGDLNAPDGGSTISFSGGGLGAASTCVISVNVTSSVLGIHTNVSGNLTSSAGIHGSATADLTVEADRPGFSKSFSPGTISFGSRSTLTFLIDNTANEGGSAINLTFSDNLPAGMVVADPANESTTCNGGIITAVPGSGTIAYGPAFPGDATVAALSSCTVSVDVIGSGSGQQGNVSNELTSFAPFGGTLSSGKASAVLDVTVGEVALQKSFIDDPVPAGALINLEFTISNFDRLESATNIAFTDDIDATLAGLTAVGLPQNDVCGSGSQISGSSSLSFSGGTLSPEASCTFTVTLQVPTDAAAGEYLNSTSNLTADLGGGMVTSDPATDVLFVQPGPILTKTYIDSPTVSGSTTTLEFTITNSSQTSAATNIAFTDIFDDVLPTAVSVPANGSCGPGSTFIYIPRSDFNPPQLILSGASLAAADSCTFQLVLNVVQDAPSGIYPNTTSNITAIIDGETASGPPASDDLEIFGAPRITKSFADDPVFPGDTVTLAFNISHTPFVTVDATNIAFTDNLDNVLSGLTAVGLPMNDVCGAGSQISGTSTLTFSGGNLSPGASCIFSVTLQVPAAATPTRYTNTTSNITADFLGMEATGNPAVDDLIIAGLTMSKSFTNDPVLPGGTVNLEFTLDNSNATFTATNITFDDNLAGVINNLSATGLPLSDICGAGSSLTGLAGNTFLRFQNGALGPGEICTFNVTLQVPAAADSNIYGNTTTSNSALVAGQFVLLDPATDNLIVDSNRLLVTKEFTDDPVREGDTVTMEFTIATTMTTQTVTGISFTDDLDAVLPGLTAVGLPVNDVCGSGSQLSGTSTLSLTGGNLAPGTSCTFSVTLQIPAGAIDGTYINTTSQLTGVEGGLGVTGSPASDNLDIRSLTFSKSFSGPSAAGATTTLSFTIENSNTTFSADSIVFADDLGNVIPGLVATGLPADDVCGTGSQLTGPSILILTEGSIPPNSSCTFSVTLQIPSTAMAGSYLNTTSNLFLAGIDASEPATDTLIIEPPPLFSKRFTPDNMAIGDLSTLSFTIDNSASILAANNLDFTDNLPAGIEVANPANATTSCSGGTITAVPGTNVISYSGGSLNAGSVCTIQVDVSTNTPGFYLNVSGDLTSSLGNSGSASDTITVFGYMKYLPLVFNNENIAAPDLVITQLNSNSGNIQVVIRNQGTTPVVNSFWVDVYINPDQAPTMVNQTWPLVGSHGMVWGVTANALPLNPGQTLTLNVNDSYYNPALSNPPASIPVGTPLYAQVDSASTTTNYGNVQETHEISGAPYNNIIGPQPASFLFNNIVGQNR